ncbi:Hypothetical predicted protein [Xyrichtys novacula]|uniref:Uncharacterized protein n=1 Tax=Xyrichtys novacula TaxID=13765 RepID=A0AAV1GZ72_XYRNO|nr:Hypothetical predicted protein [Xyrichtys novacula]
MQRTNSFRCPAPSTLHSTPCHQRLPSSKEEAQTLLWPTFPSCRAFFICLVVVCVRRRTSMSPSSVSVVFCIHPFLHYHMTLFSDGFLVMKFSMFTVGIHENNIDEEPLVSVSYMYVYV